MYSPGYDSFFISTGEGEVVASADGATREQEGGSDDGGEAPRVGGEGEGVVVEGEEGARDLEDAMSEQVWRPLDVWILDQLKKGPERAGILILRAGTKCWYVEGRPNAWRIVDRALQRLRKAGLIRPVRIEKGVAAWERVR